MACRRIYVGVFFTLSLVRGAPRQRDGRAECLSGDCQEGGHALLQHRGAQPVGAEFAEEHAEDAKLDRAVAHKGDTPAPPPTPRPTPAPPPESCQCDGRGGKGGTCTNANHHEAWCCVSHMHCLGAHDKGPFDACRWSSEPCNKQFIQFDGVTKTPVPRHETSGLVREVLIRYPMDGLTVRDKKVHFPFGSMLEAKYSRDTHVNSRADYGVQKAMWLKSNPNSMISDKVGIMILEKTHTTFSRSENFPTFSKDRAERVKAGMKPADHAQASNAATRTARNLAANLFVGLGLSGQILDNSVKDTTHREEIRKFVASEGGDLNAQDSEAYGDAVARFTERAAAAGASKTPLRSSVACIHFEDIDGMQFTSAGVDIPLDKKIVVFRGRIGFSPNQEYDFAMGYAVFKHNVERNSIDVYFAFSNMLGVGETKGVNILGFERREFSADFWVSNPDGASWPIPSEGRPQTKGMSALAVGGLATMSGIPEDFSFLYQYRQDVGCPDDSLTALEHASDLVIQALNNQDAGTMATLTALVPCAVEYLRPDEAGHSAGYTLFESLGFMHFTMELPPTIVAKALAAHVDWNTIDGVEIGKPQTPPGRDDLKADDRDVSFVQGEDAGTLEVAAEAGSGGVH